MQNKNLKNYSLSKATQALPQVKPHVLQIGCTSTAYAHMAIDGGLCREAKALSNSIFVRFSGGLNRESSKSSIPIPSFPHISNDKRRVTTELSALGYYRPRYAVLR